MWELSLFELVRLVGAGASAAQLEQAKTALGGGYALERLDGAHWVVAGWTGTEARAKQWVEFGGEPDQPSS